MDKLLSGLSENFKDSVSPRHLLESESFRNGRVTILMYGYLSFDDFDFIKKCGFCVCSVIPVGVGCLRLFLEKV